MSYVTRLENNAQRRQRPEPEWSIEGVLPPSGVCTLFGETYVGKSFVTIDLALRICNGLDDWYGHAINVHGPVVYAFMEGKFDQQRRIDAWLMAHPGTTADDFWTLTEEPLNIADPESFDLLLLDIHAAQIKPRLLIVDTQALALAGTEENDNGAMGAVLGLLKSRSTTIGYPILTVHHTGYDTSHARGASAWKAGLDLEIHVRNQEIKVSKAKGGRATEWLGFRLTQSGKSVWAKPGVGADGIGMKGISQKIIDLLEEHPAELTMKQVLDQFGNGARVRRAFADLADAGDIERQSVMREENGKMRQRDVWVSNDEIELDLSEADPNWREGDPD